MEGDPVGVSGPEIGRVEHFSIAIDVPEMSLAYDKARYRHDALVARPQ
jgi:hypothetical protein